jgi:hypothetical protein
MSLKLVDHLHLLVLFVLIPPILEISQYFSTHRTAGATILRDAYGYEVLDEEHDPMIAVANEAMEQFSRTTVPPHYMV